MKKRFTAFEYILGFVLGIAAGYSWTNVFYNLRATYHGPIQIGADVVCRVQTETTKVWSADGWITAKVTR